MLGAHTPTDTHRHTHWHTHTGMHTHTHILVNRHTQFLHRQVCTCPGEGGGACWEEDKTRRYKPAQQPVCVLPQLFWSSDLTAVSLGYCCCSSAVVTNSLFNICVTPPLSSLLITSPPLSSPPLHSPPLPSPTLSSPLLPLLLFWQTRCLLC